MFKQKGQIVLLVVFLLALVLAGLVGWFYYRQSAKLGFIDLPFLPKPQTGDFSNWKKFTTDDQRLTYLYPSDWYLIEKQFVSQYPFNPNVTGNENVENSIKVILITSQIQTSFINEDWFNKIYNAGPDDVISNEYRPVGQVKLSKIVSGNVASGQRFVVFKDEFHPNEAEAYILDGSDVYDLILHNYDQAGLEMFEKIVSTATVN